MPDSNLNPTRRSFIQMAGSGLIIVSASGFALTASGCPTIEQDVENWIPIGLDALNSIQTLLGPLVSPAIALIIAPIKTAFADLLAATEQYANDTNPADKATTLAKIQTYLNDITTNFQNLFNALPGGGIVALALSLASIVLSTIAGFLGELAPSVSMQKQFMIKGNVMHITPVKRTKRKFKSDWNSLAKANNHPEIEMHIGFWEW